MPVSEFWISCLHKSSDVLIMYGGKITLGISQRLIRSFYQFPNLEKCSIDVALTSCYVTSPESIKLIFQQTH